MKLGLEQILVAGSDQESKQGQHGHDRQGGGLAKNTRVRTNDLVGQSSDHRYRSMCLSELCNFSRVFICDACPFTTSYERNLKAHVKEVHLKEKRVHSCQICNRFKSSRRSNLTQHIR